METSLTVENYVKAIYRITAESDRPAATGAVANAVGVSPGAATSMLKSLSDMGLATHARYEGVRLTDDGTTLALRIIRRHRLIELFLHRTLGLTWDEVHEEAEHMEHAVSDRLVDRIEAYLGNPTLDPHGDPIPTADGEVATIEYRTLADVECGAPVRIVRAADQSGDFLRFLTEKGLTLNSVCHVRERSTAADTLVVAIEDDSVTLGLDAARRLQVAADR
jgi:DtxR family Mn-dependent transcriptional regulator